MVGRLLEQGVGLGAESGHRAAVVPGDVQVRLCRPAGHAADHAARALDGGRYEDPAVEGRLPPRPQHATELLARLQRQSAGRGLRIRAVALGDAGERPRLDEAVLRSARPERADDARPGAEPDRRLAPVHALGDDRRLARRITSISNGATAWTGSSWQERAVSVAAGHVGLSGGGDGERPGRQADPAAQLFARDQRRPLDGVVPLDHQLRPGVDPLDLRDDRRAGRGTRQGR